MGKKMRPLLLFALASGLQAQSASQVALIAANTADSISSMGGYEINPLLGRGEFGRRQLITKTAIVDSLVVVELAWTKKHSKSKRMLSVMNWVAAGLLAGAATHNEIVLHR